MKNSVPRNILFGFLSLFLPLVSTIIVTPFVVRGMGAEEYGLLALILGFISYSFAFGFGRAVTKYVAEYRATGETERVGEVLSATLLISLAVSLGGAFMVFWSARYFVIDVLMIEAHLQDKAISAFYLAAAIIVAVTLQQIFSAVLQAVGRFDWFSYVTTVYSTILSFGNLILVWRGGDTLILLWWNLLITIAGTVVFAGLARWSLPEADLSFRVSSKTLRLIARYSLGIVGYQISGSVWLLFERSWITRRLGTENLTFYVLPMSLAILILTLLSSVSLALMPLVSDVAGRPDAVARLLSIYQRATKYIGFIVVFIGVSLNVGGHAFFTLWLGAEYAERSGLILIFHVLTFGMMSLGVVVWNLNEGLGQTGRNGLMGLLWLVLGVCLIIILTPQFGLNGVAAARTGAVFLTTPISILVAEKLIFGKVLWRFWSFNLAAFLAAGLISGSVEYLLLKNLPLNWLTLTAAVTVAGAVFLGTMILIRFFTAEELNWLRQFTSKATLINN